MHMKAVTVLDFSMFIPIGLCSLIEINHNQAYTECKTRKKLRLMLKNVAENLYIKLEMFIDSWSMLITK